VGTLRGDGGEKWSPQHDLVQDAGGGDIVSKVLLGNGKCGEKSADPEWPSATAHSAKGGNFPGLS